MGQNVHLHTTLWLPRNSKFYTKDYSYTSRLKKKIHNSEESYLFLGLINIGQDFF